MSKASESLQALVTEFATEHDKFEKGNHSAGVRSRKVLQKIKKECTEIKKTTLVAGEESEE